MNRHGWLGRQRYWLMCGLLAWVATPRQAAAEPTREALTAYAHYVSGVEARLAGQNREGSGPSVRSSGGDRASHPLAGELVVERLTPVTGADLPGALLQHWRGIAFVPGVRASDFERLLRSFSSYPEIFSPQVLQAKVLAVDGDHARMWMRVRQKHVISVVMDTSYDVSFGRRSAQAGFSASRSIQIREIAATGTAAEHALGASEEHGFLWRLNTYWSWEERDGGLWVQVETVSLSRAIPMGLGWAVRPFVESVPRKSLEFTLRRACAAAQAMKRGGVAMTIRGMVLLWTGLLAATAPAQSQSGATAPQVGGAYDYFGRAGITVGAGSSGQLSTVGPTVQAGGIFSMPLVDLELGALGPQAGKNVAGYFSSNLWIPLILTRRVSHGRNLPLAAAGYTREFRVGNALDYGLGLAHTVREGRSIEFDVRDYWMPSSSSHTVMFRLVLLVGLSD